MFVRLHTVIDNYSEEPERTKMSEDFGYEALNKCALENCVIVEGYKNKTLEQLSEEYHKMSNDWQEKYIRDPLRKQQEKERKAREYEIDREWTNVWLEFSAFSSGKFNDKYRTLQDVIDSLKTKYEIKKK
jgi:hypothetical protein